MMMPNMMFGMGISMFFGFVFAALICLLLIGLGIWLIASRLQQQKAPRRDDTAPHQKTYGDYEQGYQPSETYQEGNQSYSYPPSEQPQAQYQEMEQLRQYEGSMPKD